MKLYLFLGVLVILGLMIVGCAGPKACTEDARVCPDGTSVARNPDLNCEFNPCPEVEEGMTKVAVSPATATVSNGDTVTLDIMVSDIEGLFGFQFDVTYNSEVLEFVEVKKGKFLSDEGKVQTYCVGSDTSTPGLIHNLVCTRLGGGTIDGTGVLETLTFTAIAPGESDIELIDVKLAQPDTNKIEHTIVNGKVVVG